MKIQFDQTSLRIRLDESDWAELLQQGQLSLCGPGPAAAWRVVLRLHGSNADLAVHAPAIELAIPQADARALEQRLPCRDGLDYALAGIRVSIEVDVRDSRKQRPRRD
ncbi:MAG: hypothetical protein KDJ14_04625 [Xanthomonadales bacterium]|nr:hypothetical protein [Xanthomonadales bacterium]